MCHFVGSRHTVFQSGHTTLRSHQQSTGALWLCAFTGIHGVLFTHSNGVTAVSLWLWFDFPWWLMMLSIFLCAYYIFFGKMLSQVFADLLIKLFVCFWIVRLLCIFWIVEPCQMCNLQILAPTLWVVFSFTYYVLWCTIVYFWWSPSVSVFLFLCLGFWCYSWDIIAKSKVMNIFPYIFFQEFCTLFFHLYFGCILS